jgi:hypothetical protein
MQSYDWYNENIDLSEQNIVAPSGLTKTGTLRSGHQNMFRLTQPKTDLDVNNELEELLPEDGAHQLHHDPAMH